MSKSFYGLVAFQRATELMVSIYDVTQSFPKQELYGLTAQLRRASVGIVAQIAEGRGRLTPGEFRQFLSQARGSLFEVEAECHAARILGYLDDDICRRLTREINGTGRAVSGLIEWVRRKEAAAKPRSRGAANARQPQAP